MVLLYRPSCEPNIQKIYKSLKDIDFLPKMCFFRNRLDGGDCHEKIRGPTFSVVRTLRHVRIRYRLLASFLLLSLVPALCVGLYASGVYAAGQVRASSGSRRSLPRIC